MSVTLVRLSKRRLPLSILAFVVLCLIMAGVAGFLLLEKRLASLDQQSTYFANEIGLHMAEHWNPNLLAAEATPKLRAQLTEDDLRALSRQIQEYGPLWMYLGAKGKLDNRYLAAIGGDVSASYAAKASYAPGVVTFDLGIVKRDGRWQIDRFHVDFLNLSEGSGGR